LCGPNIGAITNSSLYKFSTVQVPFDNYPIIQSTLKHNDSMSTKYNDASITKHKSKFQTQWIWRGRILCELEKVQCTKY